MNTKSLLQKSLYSILFVILVATAQNAKAVVCNGAGVLKLSTFIRRDTTIAFGTNNTIVDTSICESSLPYIWNGLTINSAGTYRDTLVNSLGADSIIVLVLKIKSLPVVAPIIGPSVICPYTSYSGYSDPSDSTHLGGWYMSDPTVAVVDNNGNVTFISPGIVVLGYYLSNSCGVSTVYDTIYVEPSFWGSALITLDVSNNKTVFSATVDDILPITTVTYQWVKNGALVGNNENTYSDSSFKVGDSVWCKAILNWQCGDTLITSNKIGGINLPLTLKSLSVQSLNKGILLEWTSANETNATKFIIESSVNGKTFAAIGTVTTKGGGSYSYTDNLPPASAQVYYRLRVVDNDGSYTYSKTISVQLLVNSNELFLFSNPVTNVLKLQVVNKKAETVTVQVIDMLGRVLQQQKANLSIGNNTISLPVATLAKGSYKLVIKGETLVQKGFVKD